MTLVQTRGYSQIANSVAAWLNQHQIKLFALKPQETPYERSGEI